MVWKGIEYMYKMALIGESESTLAFRAIGFDTFQVNLDEAEETLKKVYSSGKYGVIFLSEAVAEKVSELLEEYSASPFPVVNVLPILREKKNIGIKNLRRICIQATGTDIVSKIK